MGTLRKTSWYTGQGVDGGGAGRLHEGHIGELPGRRGQGLGGGEVAYMKCIMENFLVHRTGERGPVFYIRDIIENFQVH